MKLCKDCKYCEEYHIPSLGPYFQCLKDHSVDMVTGQKAFNDCLYTRQDSTKCGSESNWFEPKPIAKSKFSVIIKDMKTKLKELFK